MPNETLPISHRALSSQELSEAIEIPFTLDRFIQKMGITDTTAWRWRKRGWLNTRNIAGRVYILPKDLREFNRRMEAGDFAKDHVAPNKNKLASEHASLSE